MARRRYLNDVLPILGIRQFINERL
jgi:hypothetical protein